MRVALVTLGIYPEKTGGLEIHAYYQAKCLMDRGVDVYMFKGANPQHEWSSDNVSRTKNGTGYPRILISLFFVLRTFLGLLRIRKRIEIVHVHFATYFMIPAFLLWVISSKPFVVTCHGADVFTWGRERAWKLLQLMCFAAAAHVTATSRDVERILTSDYHLPRQKVSYIPNGIDPSEIRRAQYGDTPKGKIVVLVANLRPVKAPLQAVEAFQIATNRVPELRMTIVGDGVMRPALESYLSMHQLTDRVSVLGTQPHLETLKIIYGGSLFLLTSLAEGGNPLVLMEAMALGTPVVASSVGGVTDVVVDGLNGLLVPPNSPEKAAQAIVRVFENVTLAKRISQAAKETASGYTWSGTTASYLELYDWILLRPQTGLPNIEH